MRDANAESLQISLAPVLLEEVIYSTIFQHQESESALELPTISIQESTRGDLYSRMGDDRCDYSAVFNVVCPLGI